MKEQKYLVITNKKGELERAIPPMHVLKLRKVCEQLKIKGKTKDYTAGEIILLSDIVLLGFGGLTFTRLIDILGV